MKTEKDRREVIRKASLKRRRYDKMYLDLAIRIAQMSHAMRSKVGCLIVKDNRILSFGFNGMPSGFENTCEFDHQGELHTKKEVLHAELNAIAKVASCNESSKGATMYLTLGCCIECAKLVIQSGITRVVYLEDYRISDGIDLLKRAKINVEKLN